MLEQILTSLVLSSALCATWKYGFTGSRRDLTTIGVAAPADFHVRRVPRARADFHVRRVPRARGDATTGRIGPPWNVWCFSVAFQVETCASKIATAGTQRISQDGSGRSHQDLAIRSLKSRLNPAFAPNAAVADGAQDATHKSGTCPGVA